MAMRYDGEDCAGMVMVIVKWRGRRRFRSYDEKAMVVLMWAGCRYPASGGDEINQTAPRALLLLSAT